MKPTKHFLILAILLAFTTTASWAQAFVTPLSSLSGETRLITVDNQLFSGRIVAAFTGMKGINSLTIKESNGAKHKFKADRIQSIRVKIDGFAKLEILSAKTRNLDRLFNSDFNEIVDRQYAYYVQVKVPGKEKYVLTQLLNPGFDNKISVFDKPGAKTGETSVNNVAIKGGNARAYYVKKRGITYEITKSKYRRSQFKELFGDCSNMMRFYSNPDFDRFAEHVLYYELNCN